MQTASTTYTDGNTRRTARRALTTYFAIVNPNLDALIAGLMPVPAGTAVVGGRGSPWGFSGVGAYEPAWTGREGPSRSRTGGMAQPSPAWHYERERDQR